jgi:prepilin-type N-terminal cleavage/methylation domain-containing protein
MSIKDDDRGLTLIEVLLSVVLLGILVGAMANALIVFSRNNDATTSRLSESHDAQVAAAFFAQDVEALGAHDWAVTDFPLKASVEQNIAANTGTFQCGSDAALLRLAWDNPTNATADPEEIRVVYAIRTAGTEKQLVRTKCKGTVNQPTVWTLQTSAVLVHNLDAADPAVTCSTTCTAAAVPQKITMVIQIKAPKGSGATVTLVGQRRQT